MRILLAPILKFVLFRSQLGKNIKVQNFYLFIGPVLGEIRYCPFKSTVQLIDPPRFPFNINARLLNCPQQCYKNFAKVLAGNIIQIIGDNYSFMFYFLIYFILVVEMARCVQQRLRHSWQWGLYTQELIPLEELTLSAMELIPWRNNSLV